MMVMTKWLDKLDENTRHTEKDDWCEKIQKGGDRGGETNEIGVNKVWPKLREPLPNSWNFSTHQNPGVFGLGSWHGWFVSGIIEADVVGWPSLLGFFGFFVLAVLV